MNDFNPDQKSQSALTQRPTLATAILHWQEQGLAQPDDDQATAFHLTPQTAQQTADMLAWTQAEGFQVAFSQQAAQLLPEPQWLDIAALNHIDTTQAADFIVKVQTGTTFGALSEALAQHNQMFPLQYPPEITLAEILAKDLPSLETGIFGYPRDYVLRSEIATPDGQLTTSGADVVKNVTGYDLHKLYTGGRNAFGCLTQVTLKVQALSTERHLFISDGLSLSDAIALVGMLQTATLPLTVCELFQKVTTSNLSPHSEESSTRLWQLLTEVNGQIKLSDLPTLSDGIGWQLLENEEAAKQRLSLQQWPKDAGALEVALPLSAWSSWVENFSTRPSQTQNWQIQIRPKAGLIYLSHSPWLLPKDEATLAALEHIQKLSIEHSGFVQWAQWPACAYSIQTVETNPNKPSRLSSFWKKAAEINLPADPIQRQLLQKIQKSYDQTGVLFIPELPLSQKKSEQIGCTPC